VNCGVNAVVVLGYWTGQCSATPNGEEDVPRRCLTGGKPDDKNTFHLCL
jgi:hypothetical protein